MRSNSIPDMEVLKLALAMPWTRWPTDLVHAIRQRYKCSENVAGKVYSRMLRKYPLHQLWVTKISREAPDHTGASWGICGPTGYCHWVYRMYDCGNE